MGEDSMNIEKLKKNKSVMLLLDLNHEFFSTLLVTFLLLLLAETIWEGSVSMYMNINYLLIIVIISGAISVLTRKEDVKAEKVALAKKDYIFIGATGIAGALIIWYKIKNIGKLAYLISIVAGVLIILLSLLLLEEDEKNG
jgi:predicted membrane channel-forming protein YqfA (hemolysin III family)